MKLARHLHPVHPALAHFPIAFWIGASVCDVVALRSRDPVWWSLSHHAIAAGVVMAVVALIAGSVELWVRKLPTQAISWVTVHAGLMFTALVCFMLSLALRKQVPPPAAAVGLALAGCAIVIIAAFCGGTLVYRFGVGVAWRDDGKP